MYKDRKAVSPVVGVILMVAATIVIAAVVMSYLGGFTPPKKTLDVMASNAMLTSPDGQNWTLTVTLAGSDVDEVANDAGNIHITLTKLDTGDTLSVTDHIQGHTIVYTFNDTNLDVDQGQKVRIVITYKGQPLLDTVVIATQT